MAHIFHKPAPGLEQIVRFYVQRKVKIRGAAVVHPVPARAAALIEFNLGDPFEVLDIQQRAQRKSPTAVVVGLQTHRRVEMQLRGTVDSFVIMFQPDGLHRLFGIPMRDLTDRDYEAHSVFGAFISNTRQRLGNSKSSLERVRLVDELLLGRALRSSSPKGISAAANLIIRSGGRVGIPALADASGWGVRQFERRFMHQVGLRPKLLARIARFEAALESKACLVSHFWTQVAHDFGYYDQMHMVHGFAEFTSGTPTEALAELETVFVERIKAIRTGGSSSDAFGNSLLIL